MTHTQLLRLAGKIHEKDCVRVRRWLRTAKWERFGSTAAALADAEAVLKPKALDWAKLLEFLKAIIPLILPFIIKRPK